MMGAMFHRADRDDLSRELAEAHRRIAELELERSRERQREGRSDPLTGCLSLRSFRGRLAEEAERARRHRRPLSLVLLDVDGFRDLQRHHGYPVGDDLLVAVGAVLRAGTRSQDLVCRTGGDEFALLLVETTNADARICLERILLELEVLESGPVRGTSISAGIAAQERASASPEELLDHAGRALARARAEGAGRVAVHCEETTLEPGLGEDSPHRDVVEALAVALLERDRYTGEHSESVVEMAGSVARSLGLSGAEVERVRAAALLHDIGKVAIPDAILHKPAPLDEQEWQLMAQHPVIGERILRVIPGLGSVARIVRHEHESWNGTGYPDGLAGEEIPIGSRIILACDAYHAMTTDRPYRAAMSYAEAIEELLSSAGRQFDPRVTQAFVGYLYGQQQAGLLTVA